jgi:hypothetical protein
MSSATPFARFLGALWCLAGVAAQAEPSVATTVEHEGTLLKVRSVLAADAAPETCYAVLADLDHLADFVPQMKSSRVISAPGEPIRLRQVGDASAGPFHYTIDVTLAVKTDPPRRLEFERVAGNMSQMRGSWNVSGTGAHCEIRYEADLDPDFWVPPLIGPRLMRSQVDEQMHGILDEIERRSRATTRTAAP